jgi:hypothetical protein
VLSEGLRRRCVIGPALPLLLGFALLRVTALGQAPPGWPGSVGGTGNEDQITNAINEVKGGNYAYVQQITREAGQARAMPILEELFAHGANAETKPWIASELVKIGDKDNSYWNYVVDLATDELENGPPDFMSFDQDGKELPGASPEFLKWAKAHHIAPESFSFEVVMPVRFGMLIVTKDPRAIPLLRRGLLSPNHLLEASAAGGLAALKDRDSIPLIVEACKRAPKGFRFAIATNLLEFRDQEAQVAAEPYLPEDLVKSLHGEKQ